MTPKHTIAPQARGDSQESKTMIKRDKDSTGVTAKMVLEAMALAAHGVEITEEDGGLHIDLFGTDGRYFASLDLAGWWLPADIRSARVKELYEEGLARGFNLTPPGSSA